jgi:thioredoxin reductase
MNYPIVIIGAGPIGLAAAAHLAEHRLPFVVLEAGPNVGHEVLRWGHVQMFSPWRYSVNVAAVRLLETTGWHAPEPEAFPTGTALVEQYLAPLADHPALAPHLRFNSRVVAISRAGFDKMKTTGREQAPFVVQVAGADGSEQLLLARAVIDASGTSVTPNPLGANGLPVPGEAAHASQIFYGIPDVLGKQRERYAGQRVLVVGSGHSAFNALLELSALAEQVPTTQIMWAVRRHAMAQAYGGGSNDALPARGQLGLRLKALVDRGTLQLVTGWRSDRIEASAAGLIVHAGDQALPPVDQLIVATGLRPDVQMLHELRLGLDPAVEAPTALAPLIDPNLHSCGTVRPHGVDELAHPEPNFYIIGMKSYGRAPTFLLMTGYEQARSVTAALAGDWEAARRVELVLPETGVCSGPVVAGGSVSEAGCCGAPTRQPNAPTATLTLIPTAMALEVLPTAAANGCCSVETQTSCCAAEAKADCCGSEPSSSCGCQTEAVQAVEVLVS